MKAIRNLVLVLTTLMCGMVPPAIRAATTYTDGSVTFSVNLISIPGNYSPRVDAYWVTDAAGNFVMTMRYDAGSRRQYLYQWVAARGSWPYNAPIDGYSGATISTWGTFAVNWDCRNTNNVLMPDGQYKLWVEMTDRNGQGPYTTNGIVFWKGMTNVNNTYPNQQYIQNITVAYAPALAYDVAVTGIAPAFGATNAMLPVTVALTNKTSVPETFTVTLSNATSGVLIGTASVNNLGGNETTNVTIQWNTAGLLAQGYSIVARASAVAGETNLADNAFTRTITLRPPTHDVGVVAITVPANVRPEMRTNVSVTVTNKGDAVESFAVVLSDDTDGKTIGTNQVASLAAQAGVTTTFQWSTTNASWGTHTLRAVAATVPSETATADNTLSVLTTVMPPMTTNTYLVKSNYWLYHDQGVDLGTAWKESAYDDSAWSLGRGPLGYGDAPTNTVLSWGPDSAAKYPCYYFRAKFNITNMPSGLILRLRRDDGAVVYHNGVEIYRTNMPLGTISYTTWALAAVGSPNETVYFETNLTAANSVVGTNVIAVEIHQNAGDSSDLSFDLELLGAVPPFVPSHDVAIRSITAPGQAVPGTVTNITVSVTNRGNFAESFAVVLNDDTDGIVLATNQISNLGTNAAVNSVFAWNVPVGLWQDHTLRAVAGPLAGEASRADNTNTVVVFVTPPLETNVLIGKSNFWRYNDTGTDLTFTPWKQIDYLDGTWGWGQGSLGYGDLQSTYLMQSNPPSTSKLTTYYFRKTFNVDVLPNWMRIRLRRDDGAVLYHNGVEIFRVNITNNPVYYSHFASATVDGANETTYFESEVSVTNAVLGPNVIAAEVHQINATSSDLSFDLEVLGINPATPRVHDVAASAVSTFADALVGDQVQVVVTVTNRGNASETFTVYLRDTNSNQIVASRVVSNLAVNASATLTLDWSTPGASPGVHTLEAFTVRAGVTNFAGAALGQGTLVGTGFGLNMATVAGSVGGRCTAVTVSGNLLVVGAGATLEVWDRANPAVPVQVGAVRLPGLIEDIVVSGNLACAACGSAGVQLVDISSPAAPAHVNTYDTSGHASGLATSGNLLFVADGVAGLRIIDITNPTTPLLVGAYYTTGPARSVSVAGTVAYLLDSHNGLFLLNVANPAVPALLGSYAGFDAAQDLAVAGNYAYVVDANNRFYVVNIANPAVPVLANAAKTFLLTNLVAQSIVLNGGAAYVPCGDGGMAVLNVTAPSAPAFVRTVATSGQAVVAAVTGTMLYLADGFQGLQVYDVTSATSPALQTELPTSIRAWDVVVNGNLAFVAAGEAGMRIYDVSSAAKPVWLGWYAGALNARCVAAAGNTVCIGDGQYGLKLVDVSTPASPSLLGSWAGTNLASIRNVGLSGSQVVASDGQRVCLFDVSSPAAPALLATYATPAFAFDMTVVGTHAFLACGSAGFVILEIGASALTPMSVTDTPGVATGISVGDTTAYIADGGSGWLIYNIANPAAPVLVQANASQGPVSSVAVSGLRATLGNGANAVVTMDATVPLAPVTSQSFTGLVNAVRLAASGSRVFVAENEAGLAVLGSDPAPLVLQILPPSGGTSNFTLSWASKTGKTYSIYKSYDLALGRAGFVLAESGIPATPPMNSMEVNGVGNVTFYIISEE